MTERQINQMRIALTAVIIVNVLALLVNLVFAFLRGGPSAIMHLTVAAISFVAILGALFVRRELKKEGARD